MRTPGTYVTRYSGLPLSRCSGWIRGKKEVFRFEVWDSNDFSNLYGIFGKRVSPLDTLYLYGVKLMVHLGDR